MVKQTRDTPPMPEWYRAKRYHTSCVGCTDDSKCPKGSARRIRPIKSCYKPLVVDFEEEFPLGIGIDWPETIKEQRYCDEISELREKNDKFPWYVFGLGWTGGTLFWTLINYMFGG